MDDELRAYLQWVWRQVQRRSGRLFDLDAVDRFAADWIYDTGPACRAIVAVRGLSPADGLGYFGALQHAFYAEGRDITEIEVQAQLLDGFAPTPKSFVACLESSALAELTLADYALAARLGAKGYPTLFLRDSEQTVIVARGYRKADAIFKVIDTLFPELAA